MCVYGSCVQCLQKPKEGDLTPGTGFRGICALPVVLRPKPGSSLEVGKCF